MIGANIKKLRKANRLTQEQLATQIGVSTSTIGMYEQNRREPDADMITRLCHYFDVSSDYLILNDYTQKKEPLSKDLTEIIDDLHDQLLGQSGLMFNGVLLCDEDKEKIVSAIKIGAALAIEKNKKNTQFNH